MALQDLTPQLRTRLSRVERAVGLFVLLAALLLISGFVYYVYHVGTRKGWFVNKVPYNTLLLNATGLKVGDPVKLMGFDAGEITEIETMPPESSFGIYVQFRIKAPYYGYLWKDSKARVAAADFLGKRFIQLTKGADGPATVLETNKVFLGKTRKVPWGILDDHSSSDAPRWLEITNGMKGYFLPPDETPALTEKLDEVMKAVEAAWPELTNKVVTMLASTFQLTSNLNAVVADARPTVTNLAVITGNLREPKGSLGEWLIPTNVHRQLEATLTNANSTLAAANGTLTGVNTNLDLLAANLNRSLINLAELTGNLNSQVQANSLILTEISTLVINVDELVQGLKRHWLLRSSFGNAATNAPVKSILSPSVGREK